MQYIKPHGNLSTPHGGGGPFRPVGVNSCCFLPKPVVEYDNGNIILITIALQ